MSALDIVEAGIADTNKAIRAINDKAESESRAALTEDEAASYATLRDERTNLESRKAELVEEARRETVAAETRVALTPAGDGVKSEPSLYRQGNKDPNKSFIRDFLAARNGNVDARDRMIRNSREVNDIYTRAGVTTVTGAGGEFDPPSWLIANWIALPRAGRAFANVVRNEVLPGGVSSLNIPAIATGTTTAAQSTQNTAVSNTDPTTTSVAISISTVAGYNLLSQQNIDQSPIDMTEVVLSDLIRSYDKVLDTAVITAVAGTSGIIAQTYTDAAPTTAKVNSQVLTALYKVYAQRFDAPSVILMHPARWAGFLGYLDSQGRPLVVPQANGYTAFNNTGVFENQAQGVAGNLWGIPVVVDPNIPQNLGAGTNQDEIFVLKADDILLYESAPSMDTQVAPYANQLSVLVRFWRYYGVGVRTAKSVAAITGTGMIQPAIGS